MITQQEAEKLMITSSKYETTILADLEKAIMKAANNGESKTNFKFSSTIKEKIEKALMGNGYVYDVKHYDKESGTIEMEVKWSNSSIGF